MPDRDETLRLHDLYYGRDHCDRKYVEVCTQFMRLLFDDPDYMRQERGDEE